MAQAIKVQVANLQQYNETADAEELIITAKDGPVNLSVRVPCATPCIVFYDPTTHSFHTRHVDGVDPTFQFVSMIVSFV